MAVRTNTGSTLDEELEEVKEDEPWDEDSNGADHQVRLDRHALVSHGKQIAAVQDQLTQVVTEMGDLRRLCSSARNHARKTNEMLETLGKHLGVQLKSSDIEGDEAGS
jgi:hypothetical protein